MNPHERGLSYFGLGRGSDDFWSWGSAQHILWTDGSVVATQEELLAVLRRLQSTGLPGFGAIVHLIGGCRGKRISLAWSEPSKDQQRNYRVPCQMESCGKRVFLCQRVLMFSTPEAIEKAANRLAGLPEELREHLDDPEALAELAALVFSELDGPTLSEGIIGLFANDQFAGEHLNNHSSGAKYPNVLQDLAQLSKLLSKLPAGELGAKLTDVLAKREDNKQGVLRRLRVLLSPARTDIRTIRQFELPLNRQWQEAAMSRWGFCASSLAAEDEASRLVVVRCTWDGTAQIARWRTDHPERRVLIVPVGDDQVLVHQAGCPMLQNQFLPPLGRAFAQELVAGCGGWLPTGTLQMAWSGGHVWVLARHPEREVLIWRRHTDDPAHFLFDTHPPSQASLGDPSSCAFAADKVVYETHKYSEHIRLAGHQTNGRFQCSNPSSEFQALLDSNQEFVPMATIPYTLAVGIGNQLIIFHHLDVLATYTLEKGIKSLCFGESGERSGVVICFDQGVKLHWLGSDDVLPVDNKVTNPTAAFTAGGQLVVAGDRSGRVYELGRCGPTAFRSFEWQHPAPVAVLAPLSAGEFATLSQDGSVRLWGHE